MNCRALRQFLKKWTVACAEKIYGAFRGEKGTTVIEYALVAVLIAIAFILAFRNAGVSSGVSGAASKINNSLSTPP
jgi:Flp pilus assembly pilin Flp